MHLVPFLQRVIPAHCSPAGVWLLATLAVSLHLSVFSHTVRHLCVFLCASITSCPPGPLYVSQPLVRLSQDQGRSLQSAAWACLLHDALSSSVHVSVSFFCVWLLPLRLADALFCNYISTRCMSTSRHRARTYSLIELQSWWAGNRQYCQSSEVYEVINLHQAD